MSANFDGIAQKLYRSKEHIQNLEVEIDRFFKESKYPVLTDNNRQVVPEALEYHRGRPIPPRFAVLAGEVIHHLRSILDHIVWQFSDPIFREAHGKQIEFPILQTRPAQKDVFTSYERKIKGVSKPVVRALIERLQPYNCPDPVDSLLLVIHNFDVIDKHRELVLAVSTGAIQFPMDLFTAYMGYETGVLQGPPPVDLKAELQRNAEIVPQVAFSEFGRAKAEPMVQGLNDLQNFIVNICAEFDRLSK